MNTIESWQLALRILFACNGLVIFVQKIPENSPFFKVFRNSAKPLSAPFAGPGEKFFQILSLAVFLCLAVTLRLQKYRFVIDFFATVSLFSAWLLFTRRIRPLNAVYVSLVVFLCYDFCTAAINSFYMNGPYLPWLWQRILAEGLFGAALLLLCRFVREYVVFEGDSMTYKEAGLLALSVLPYLFIRSGDLLYESGTRTLTALEPALFLTIAATFGTLVGNRSAMRAQSERNRRLTLEMEMKERQKEYLIRRETVREVNRRYHDMIKYARLFDAARPASDFPAYLEKRMTEDLSIGSMLETGSEVVDRILWERTQRCQKAGIRLIPLVCAEGLDFMEEYDLHTILANALDNAIEACEGVSDPEKREIQVTLKPVERMVLLRVVNPYEGERKTAGGRLVTNKEDAAHHGFGFENLRAAAERYNGTAAWEADGESFVLSVLIPGPFKPAEK